MTRTISQCVVAPLTGLAAVLLLAGLVAACGDDEPTGLDPDVARQLDDLRAATASFDDIDNARAAGWDVRFPPECLTHTGQGGMGVHQLNGGLVDGTVAVTEPELLVYEPQADGTVEFVAVEYIIPFSIRPRDGSPPTLFEREFSQNDTYDVWALHAWHVKDNPAGTFQPFNPDITCANADTVRAFP